MLRYVIEPMPKEKGETLWRDLQPEKDMSYAVGESVMIGDLRFELPVARIEIGTDITTIYFQHTLDIQEAYRVQSRGWKKIEALLDA